MTEPLIGSATEQNERPARISVTFLGYELFCDRCQVVGTYPTQVEAQAAAREHKKTHA